MGRPIGGNVGAKPGNRAIEYKTAKQRSIPKTNKKVEVKVPKCKRCHKNTKPVKGFNKPMFRCENWRCRLYLNPVGVHVGPLKEA